MVSISFSLTTINFATMANSDNKDGNDLIPNRTDNPVVPHPILPELPKFFAGQRLPKGARIIKGGDPILQYLNDSTLHNTIKHANNRVECDDGRLKARLRPMRGLKTDRTARVVIAGHAFIQNLRRGHYEVGMDTRHPLLRLPAAIDELAPAI